MQYLWLCPLCLVLAAAFIAVEKSGRYVEADVIKGAASLCFVALGLLGGLKDRPDVDSAYTGLIMVGLAIGAVADVILNLRYVFEGQKGKIAFLAGILVFLAGHVAYLLAVARRCNALPVLVGLGLVLTGALMMWIFQRIEASMAFKVFGVFYIGAITVMNCVAFGALISQPSANSAMFFCGSLLFLASDILLILNTFGPEQRFSWRVANLMLYYVGQLMIALSLQLM
ncbi:MAG: lysoplasmalogenase [Atopobiaceae bacterium]|nr:lysoplasmalogenase [Atopobiaceae bacterium]